MPPDNTREWLLEVSEILAEQTLTIIEDVKKPVENAGLEDKLTHMYVQTFVHLLVAAALSDYRKHKFKDKQEAYNHTVEKFHALKYNLQNSISVGFEEAWAQVYNQYVDYYVAIEQVPPPINSEDLPC